MVDGKPGDGGGQERLRRLDLRGIDAPVPVERLLHDVLGLADGAEHAIGDREQPPALGVEQIRQVFTIVAGHPWQANALARFLSLRRGGAGERDTWPPESPGSAPSGDDPHPVGELLGLLEVLGGQEVGGALVVAGRREA
jgi:hypothetical protein